MNIQTLQTILEHDYLPPENTSREELIPPLMEALSSTDSDLRENSLDILWEWIVRNTLPAEQVRTIGMRMAGNLAVGLGETNTDTVFQRAFSALILGAVITCDETLAASGQGGFLDKAIVQEWLDQALRLFSEEKDLRGHVAVKGWAHCIAHTADLLMDFSRHRFLAAPDLKRILETIAAKITAPANQPLLYNEDERISRTVISVLLRDALDQPFLAGWLDSFVHPSSRGPWKEAFCDEAANNARVNTKTFLRSLHYQLLFGIRKYQNHPYFKPYPSVRDALLPQLEQAIRGMDGGSFYAPPAGA